MSLCLAEGRIERGFLYLTLVGIEQSLLHQMAGPAGKSLKNEDLAEENNLAGMMRFNSVGFAGDALRKL